MSRIPLCLMIVFINIVVLFEVTSKKTKKAACNPEFFSQYHTSSDIFAFIDACSEKYGAKSQAIGKSAEGKSLKIITLGSGPKEIFVMAGLHGREWIAPAATIWALHELLRRQAEQDPKINDILLKNTIHFLSLINPDGYDYSRTKSETQDRRQWRKNRRLLPCKGDRCAHGVDLNRNWGVEGKTFGFGSSRPTSDVFQGKRPFSEPEIKAIRDWLLENERGKHIEFALDIHCCSQTVLPPSYYHDESPTLQAEHLSIVRRVANAMTAVNKEQYGFRKREKEFSATNSGISVDWLYGEGDIGLALIVETRGNEKDKKLANIFDVDPKEIEPIGGEVLAAIFAVSQETLSTSRIRQHSAPLVEMTQEEKDTTLTSSDANIELSNSDLTAIQGHLPTNAPSASLKRPLKSVTVSWVQEDEKEDIIDEEETLAPLIVDPEDVEPQEAPPSPIDLTSEDPPPIPGDDDDESFSSSPDDELWKSPSYLRRHRKYLDTAALTSQASMNEVVRSSSDEDSYQRSSSEESISVNNGVSHSESLPPQQETPREKDVNPQAEEKDSPESKLKEDQELDAEIQVILDEVKLTDQLPVETIVEVSEKASVHSKKEVETKDSTKVELSKTIIQPSTISSINQIDTKFSKKMTRHDEGLLIVDEDDEEHEGGGDDDDDDDSEELSRRLRNRINQLRALRKANAPSKWSVLKMKLRKGRWRAPVAFAIAVFLLWHFATKKNRIVRRDD